MAADTRHNHFRGPGVIVEHQLDPVPSVGLGGAQDMTGVKAVGQGLPELPIAGLDLYERKGLRLAVTGVADGEPPRLRAAVRAAGEQPVPDVHGGEGF